MQVPPGQRRQPGGEVLGEPATSSAWISRSSASGSGRSAPRRGRTSPSRRPRARRRREAVALHLGVASQIHTGCRPTCTARSPPAGANQCMSWRSTRAAARGRRAGRRPGAGRDDQAPRVVRRLRRWTVTPRSVAVQPSTRSPNRRSAPAASARRRCSRTVCSGRTNPLRSSNSATVSSAGANSGNRCRMASASSSSCGSPCCRALASDPATVSDVRGADHQAAGQRQRSRPVSCLEVGVQLVGAQQQRHVGRVLEVGLPDDPRVAVARPQRVRRGELLEAEHPSRPGQRGAPRRHCPCRRGRGR